MSQRVVIDYNGMSINAIAQCEVASHALCKINSVIDYVTKSASKFQNQVLIDFENELLNEKNNLTRMINDLKISLEKYKGIQAVTTYEEYSESRKYLDIKKSIQNQISNINNLVNTLTGEKLLKIKAIVRDSLLNFKKDLYKETITINQNVLSEINKIEDTVLKHLAYEEMVKNNSLSFDEVLSLANKRLDIMINGSKEETINEYKEELVKEGLDSEVLNNVNDIDEANKIVNESIKTEKIRKETLKIIIGAIKKRGFIVDTKHNLKIDRKNNVVKLVCLKASGQKAEFEVQLNGKFMYHFGDYEGSACKKDIEPFLEDLKNIYDVDILHKEIIEENPDKIQMKRYQTVNHNKGTY